MRTSEVSFRPVVPSDIEVLLRLMRGLQEDDAWSVPFRDEQVRETLHELLANPSAGVAFLILHGDRCAGYFVLSFDFSLEFGGKNAWIDELFVMREFRGIGVGSKTLEYIFQTARTLGAKVLHIEVNRGNPAISLYRRNGFEEQDRYLMSKWLE